MLSACVNLDLNPLSEGSSENWYSSKAEIEMSLNDFYRTDFFPIYDMTWSDDVTARNTTSGVQNGTLTSENGTIAARWQNYYKGIARALRSINKMDKALYRASLPPSTQLKPAKPKPRRKTTTATRRTIGV